MRTRAPVLAAITLCGIVSAVCASELPGHPFIRHIDLPVYSARARLSGAEGTVVVPLVLDKECHVSGGPKDNGVSRDLQGAAYWMVLNQLQLSGCDGKTEVNFVFQFSLTGEPTNGWSPTRVRQVSTYGFAITTQPPKLDELRLQRIDKLPVKDEPIKEEKGNEADGSSSSLEGPPLIFPDYPPLARQAGIQGEVNAVAALDEDCRVIRFEADGQSLLRASVEQAFRSIASPRRKCATREVRAKFRFILAGDKTGDWAPTRLEFSSPYTVVVSTAPLDSTTID